jgi:hypothetical protein
MKLSLSTVDIERYVEEVPSTVWNAMGQLSSFDRLIYYWAARDFYSGLGTIVDGGALVGATTTIFAEGLKSNPLCNENKPVIHVYDLFQDEKDGYSATVIKGWYGEQSNHESVYDWEHIFRKNMLTYATQIDVHKGDITKQIYTDQRKIEILSIDVAKSSDLMLEVGKKFFPLMLEERSIVLHQDYIFAFQPWLHIAMEKLSGHFQKVYDPPTNCTSVFQLVKPLLESDVTRILGESGKDYYNLKNAQYLYQAIEHADTNYGKIILTAALSYFYLMMDKRSTAEFVARRMLDEFDVSKAFIDRTELSNLFNVQLGIDYQGYFSEVKKNQLDQQKFRTMARRFRDNLRARVNAK